MNNTSSEPAKPLSMEEGVSELMNKARECISQRCQKCEDQIRKSPRTAVLGAVAVGYLLHLLPLRAILVTKVKVLSALTPPALLLFGAGKLYEFLQQQGSGNQNGSGGRVRKDERQSASTTSPN